MQGIVKYFGICSAFMHSEAGFVVFRLVGGTSLALQIGHRVSVDLDLFCADIFDEQSLREYQEHNYGLQTDYISK